MPKRARTKRYFADPELRDGEVEAWGCHLEAAGWRRTFRPDWQLYLARGLPSPTLYAELGPRQWVNRFPGMAAYAVKSCLAENLETATRALRERTSAGDDRCAEAFHPRTFLLPEGYEEWRRAAESDPSRYWLLKPKASSRGRGIKVIRNLDEVPGSQSSDEPYGSDASDDWLVQQYISEPHLIDGYKYGLRFYVLVTSLDPLVFYVHEVATCRVATRPYSLEPGALEDPVVHLINTAIQQTNTEVAWWRLNTGLDGYRQRLRDRGLDDQLLLAKIHQQLTQTIIACREQALIESRAATAHMAGCFEFLGVDFQIDDRLEPWILECNPAPPMEDEGGFDRKTGARFQAIKDALMSDTLSLLALDRDLAEWPSAGEDPTSYWIQRAERELASAGGWRRLWPASDADRWIDRFPLPRPLDRALAHRACPAIPEAEPTLAPAPDVETMTVRTAAASAPGIALYDPRTHNLIALNDSAAAVWLALGEGLTVSQTIEELCQGFGETAPKPTVESDVWDLLVAWAQRGLLAGFERTPIDRMPDSQAANPAFAACQRQGLLIVPTARLPIFEPSWPLESTRLPCAGVEALVLVHPISDQEHSRLRPGAPASVLDTLALLAQGPLFPSSQRAREWLRWVGSLELFELDLSLTDADRAEDFLPPAKEYRLRHNDASLGLP